MASSYGEPASPEHAAAAGVDRAKVEQTLFELPKHLYLERADLRLAVATWNVQSAKAKAVAPGELRGWLQAKRGADIIVVGLQEVQSDGWIDKVTKEVVPFYFNKVVSKHDNKLATIVFVHSKHVEHVANATVSSKKISGFGKAGTKGVLAARFTLYAKRFLFINCHFDANLKEGGALKRDMNFQMVLDELAIAAPKRKYTMGDAFEQEPLQTSVLKLVEKGAPYVAAASEPGSPLASSVNSSPPGTPRAGNAKHNTLAKSSLGKHDYIVWFGDLNYRVTAPLADVEEAIARKTYSKIMDFDELSRSILGKKGFHQFKEAEITFPPTYKYYKGDNNFDTSKRSGVRRVPSYCDRVLFCCNPTDAQATQLLERRSNLITPFKYKMYNKHPGHKISDHRPLAWLAGVAVYIPQPEVLTRTADLVLTGKNSAEIAQLVSEDLCVPLDMETRMLYKPIPPPITDIVGDGYVYSSDDEDELAPVETLDYLHMKMMSQRVAALERDVRSRFYKFRAGILGLSRDGAQVQDGLDAVHRAHEQRRVDDVWNLLGELNECGHRILDRCDERSQLHGPEKHERRMARQHRRRTGEVPTIFTRVDDPLVDTPNTAPEMCDEISDGLRDIARRLERAMQAAAGMDPPRIVAAGDEPLPQPPVCGWESVRDRTAWLCGGIVARRRIREGIVEEPESLQRLKDRLAWLTNRERGLQRREAAADAKMDRLNAVHEQLNKDGLGREAEKAILRDTGRKMREGMLDEELKLLQHRAAMSREQLRVLQVSGRSESATTYRTASLAKQKQHVDTKALTCSLLQSHLETANQRPPSPPRREYGEAAGWVPFPGGGGGAVAVSQRRLPQRRSVERSEDGSPLRRRHASVSPPPPPRGASKPQPGIWKGIWKPTGGGYNPPTQTSPVPPQTSVRRGRSPSPPAAQLTGGGGYNPPVLATPAPRRSPSPRRPSDSFPGRHTEYAPPPFNKAPPPCYAYGEVHDAYDGAPYSAPEGYFSRHPATRSPPRTLHGARSGVKVLGPNEGDSPVPQDSFLSMLMMNDCY